MTDHSPNTNEKSSDGPIAEWYPLEQQEPDVDALMEMFDLRYATGIRVNHPWLWRMRLLKERFGRILHGRVPRRNGEAWDCRSQGDSGE